MQISSVQIKASPVTMQLLFESDEAIGIESLPAATIWKIGFQIWFLGFALEVI